MSQKRANNEVNLDAHGDIMPSVATNARASNVGRSWCGCVTVVGDSITARRANHRIGDSLLIGAKCAAICQSVLNLEECLVVNPLHFFTPFCDVPQRHREAVIPSKGMRVSL